MVVYGMCLELCTMVFLARCYRIRTLKVAICSYQTYLLWLQMSCYNYGKLRLIDSNKVVIAIHTLAINSNTIISCISSIILLHMLAHPKLYNHNNMAFSI